MDELTGDKWSITAKNYEFKFQTRIDPSVLGYQEIRDNSKAPNKGGDMTKVYLIYAPLCVCSLPADG